MPAPRTHTDHFPASAAHGGKTRHESQASLRHRSQLFSVHLDSFKNFFVAGATNPVHFVDALDTVTSEMAPSAGVSANMPRSGDVNQG